MSTVIDELLKALCIFAVLLCIGWYAVQQLVLQAKIAEKIGNLNDEIVALKLENVSLIGKQQEIVKQFAVLTDLTDEQRKTLVAANLGERLSDTNDELSSLKDIMLQTPEKALKLERLQIKQDAEFNVLETKITSLKEQFGTVLSLLYVLVGFAVALVGYIWHNSHLSKMHNKALKGDAASGAL